MIDESLQSWCTRSLALARRRLSIEIDTSANPIAAETDAERVIEYAVFVKLVEIRGIDFTAFAGNERRPVDSSFQCLVDDCPVTESSRAEILGQIHEYLVANRESRTANAVRRNSKVRTVNGVVYSPAFVTDYIVRHTVGERIKTMTPVDAEAVTILDPAMGCGAFLLAAFRHLIAWHLEWYVAHRPDKWPEDVKLTVQGWRLTFQRCHSILRNNLFGVDLDEDAIEVARRTLCLTLFESSVPGDKEFVTAFHSRASAKPERPGHPTVNAIVRELQLDSGTKNLKQGHALIGPEFGASFDARDQTFSVSPFSWTDAFPQVAAGGGFDFVIGNPPYRRERNFKRELDEIAATPLGRHRSPRMDLWYYFVHRGIELLKDHGSLSYITNAYWLRGTGAGKLIATLRDEVSLDELFLLRNQPVFSGVQGQHLIFRLKKSPGHQSTTIKIAPSRPVSSSTPDDVDLTNVRWLVKSRELLFRDGRLDVWPPADTLLDKLAAFPRLIELGIVRQGIAENPSTINRRTLERFRGAGSDLDWQSGEGVFSLTAVEAENLNLLPNETELLRPYHDLCDVGRYWLAANPSRHLIYSTHKTCSDITAYPTFHRHLVRFRTILDARRETQSGSNRWWHLHWPRDERIWRANKLIVLQLALRPSFVSAFQPTYVPFSANVFLPDPTTREDLRYLCALLNSRVLWAWLTRHAKHRGIGLELNGHVLAQAPIRRIEFGNPNDVARHDELVGLVEQRMILEQQRVAGERPENTTSQNAIQSIEQQLDAIVASLYGLDSSDMELVDDITAG